MKMAIGKILAAILMVWSSRKLWMCLFAIALMWGIYWHTAYHITKLAADLPADKLGVLLPILNDLYQVMMYGTVTVAVGFTGFQTLQGFTRNSTGSVVAAATTIVESVTEKIDHNITITEKYDPAIEKKFADQYAGDESYRPPATVPKEEEGWTRP